MDLDEPAAETEERRRYSPLVLRLADEFEIDLTRIRGTGPGGRVTRIDVQAVIEAQAEPELEIVLDPFPGAEPPSGEIEILPEVEPAPTPDPDLEAPDPEDGDEDLAPDLEAPEGEDGDEDLAPEVTERAAPEQGVPVVVTYEADVTDLLQAQWRLEEASGRSIPVEALLVRLLTPALAHFPHLLTPAPSSDLPDQVPGPVEVVVENLSVADSDPDPLVPGGEAPSVRIVGADSLGLVALAEAIEEATLAGEAPTGGDHGGPGLAAGPSMGVDHIGSTGAVAATPVLGPGAVAAVSYGRPRPHLQLVDGQPREQVVLTLTGAFDPASVTPGEGARFLACVAAHLEDPILAFALDPPPAASAPTGRPDPGDLL